MSNTSIIDIIGDIAPQFANEDVDKLNRFIGYAKCEVNSSIFKGDQMCYDKAVAYFTSHLLAKSSMTASSSGAIKRKKEGDLECEFSDFGSDSSLVDSTQYLTEFNKIMRSRTPIVVMGC
jgi:hypothetical protein